MKDRYLDIQTAQCALTSIVNKNYLKMIPGNIIENCSSVIDTCNHCIKDEYVENVIE